MIDQPKVLGIVEAQIHKSYGGNHRIILPPIFENVAVCHACGKEKHVNTCGFCEDCWIRFSHLRGRNAGGSS